MTERDRYDAVLVHGYMYKSPEQRLSLRNRMQDSVIRKLYKKEEVGTIFLGIGKVWGENKPSLAELMAEELIRRGVDRQDIVIKPDALDTKEEIRVFLEEAHERGWENIASLASTNHQRRVKSIYRKLGQKVDHLNTEEVLNGIKQDRSPNSPYSYKRFVRRFTHSPKERIFMAKEAFLSVFYFLGLEDWLTKAAKSTIVQRLKAPFDK